jgi:S-adenosylmethionine uptake transporter
MKGHIMLETVSPYSSKRQLLWMFRKGYLQGVFWITLVALTSNMNDILMRLGGRLPGMELTFFRYFFAVLILLPIMLREGKNAFRTTRIWLHILRGVLLFAAVALWASAVTMVPLAVMSTFALTVPLFVLPLARLFLKEPVGWQRILATLTGCMGILIIIYGSNSSEIGFWDSLLILNKGVVYLIIACVLFALSDILNKKYVTKESTTSMLFYISLCTAILGFIPAQVIWVTPTSLELIYMFVLGAGGNLVLYFLLQAFVSADISALAPYRYTELLFSGLFGFIFFAEIPTQWTFIGASIIAVATASIAYYEYAKTRGKVPKWGIGKWTGEISTPVLAE